MFDMAVRFVLGRSGSGKTRYCLNAIVDSLTASSADGQSLLLLVPEQATYQAERSILCDERISGYHRLHVLSFDRLQFLLLGKNTARPELSRTGRQMIVHRILRQNRDRLRIFAPSATSPGLAQKIACTIAELHDYAKTPDDVDELLDKLDKEADSLTALKFADISLIFKEYLEAIEGRFTDPDVQLSQARNAIAGADFIKGAKLWVDGFAGFTTSELDVLAELIEAAADTEIALCLDPSEIDLLNPADSAERPGLFSPTEATYARLLEIVKKRKLKLAGPMILDTAMRFSTCEELGHIERGLFESGSRKIKAGPGIRIISAANARAEVRFVAREVLRLVTEKGCRYRDIAVIASDIESYQHYVAAYFADYEIPFFIDRRKLLNQHPIVQLICSALRVAGEGFSSSDIFAYLKTDLVPVDDGDIDLLENYCIAFGVDGRDWRGGSDWSFAGNKDDNFDENRINHIRNSVARPLLELRDKLYTEDGTERQITAEEFTRIVFDFLDQVCVCETLSAWIEQGTLAAIKEHRQCYDKLLSIFDELVEVFGAEQLRCSDLVGIVGSAFSQITLAFIPPTLDQVLVGSIERSRHPDLKAVFLIGTTQRQFPVPVTFDSILTEADRAVADQADFALAPGARSSLIERQYLAYIAFTRPSQFLSVTYPASDEGGGIVRSQFIDNLEALFENLSPESVTGEKVELEQILTPAELAELLCRELGADSSVEADKGKQLEALVSDMAGDEELRAVGSQVLSSTNYDNRAELDKHTAGAVFEGPMRTSATRLSMFAACPYRYFAGYVLGLNKRQEFKFEPLDMGQFYHDILDMLLRKLNTDRKNFATIADDDLLGILRAQTAQYVSENPFVSNFVRHGAHNAFMITNAAEVLEDCVIAIARMVRAGSFRPQSSEVMFKQYELPLSNGRSLILRGKIDRIDTAKDGDSEVTIIFDYKRKEKRFDWAKFYHGLDMQLPIYMLAVRNADEFKGKIGKVIGAFFMPVEAGSTGAALGELEKRAEGFVHKARGIFDGEFFERLDGQPASGWSKFYNFAVDKNNGQYSRYNISGALKPEDFEEVLRFCEQKVVQLAEEIASGKIDVAPYRLAGQSPCSYCDYRAVCRFDWQISDYRILESCGKTGVLEETEGDDG